MTGEPEGVLTSGGWQNRLPSSEAGDLVHEVDTSSGAITRDVMVGLRQTARICGRRQSSPAPPSSSTAPKSSSPAAFPSCRRDAQGRRDAGRHRHGQERQDRLRGAWARRACRCRRRGHAQGSRLHPLSAKGIALSRDEKALDVANSLGDDVSIINTARRKSRYRSGEFPWHCSSTRNYYDAP
jgi:hypothetical protein